MEPWRTLSEDTVFEAPPFLRVVRQRVALPDGREIDDFYQVLLRDFAAVVPVTEDGRILIVRQYKHGPGRVSVTFPAGFVEDDEPPQTAAIRELREETGYEASTWRPLGRFTDNGNQRGCRGSFFLATGCRAVTQAASGDLEEMSIETMTPAELDALMGDGGFALTHMVAAWGLARRYIPG
jgi:ADP-ribose pyrophosphatase